MESAVDQIGVRLTAPRQPHQREGHERFTLDRILAEEAALLDLVDARDVRALMWVKDTDTRGCRRIRNAPSKTSLRHRGWCSR